jgi:glycosyltransferase involved in cell wall biosynthesis
VARSPVPREGEPRRVYILARKALLHNARIFNQAKSLADAGCEVVVIGIKPPGAAEREHRDGYTIVRLPLASPEARSTPAAPSTIGRARRQLAFPLRSWRYYRAAYRLVRSELPPPDVLHANDADTLLVAVALGRRCGRPVVYDAQELYTGIQTLPGWYRRLMAVQERVLMRRVDRVTAVNDAIAEAMERASGRRIDAVVLNCPPYEPSPAGPSFRERLGLPAGARVMLYSGGLRPDRGIEHAVRALEHLPGWHLVLVGSGPLEGDLVRLAAERGLSDRMWRTGFVPHAEVPRFIGSADVGVIPYLDVGLNHYLCSPSKLFHYMMAELPTTT